MQIDSTDIGNRFAYHRPSSATVSDQYQMIRDLLEHAAQNINTVCPASWELSLALTKLEEAMFWANAAIARHP